jgi:hypothetical protein
MDLTGQQKQKQWLRPLFNILNKSNKNIALILASVNVISFFTVFYIIERYHERRRKDPTKP